MLINKLFSSHIQGLCSMTHSKCSVKESSHTFRICPTVSKMGKEGIRDEAFTELIIHLKLLCVLGSENFINRVSENRAHQSPGECASGNCPPVALRNDWGGPRAISAAYFLESTDSDWEKTKQNTTTTTTINTAVLS